MPTKKKTGAQAPADPLDDIQAAWRALYVVGDEAIARARAAAQAGDIAAAKEALQSWDLAWAAIKNAMPMSDLAIKGRTFQLGRKSGTGSPIRKLVAKSLARNQNLTNDQLWDALKAKPPAGWSLFENRLGKYAEGPNNKSMSFERFRNVCAEERRKLKG